MTIRHDSNIAAKPEVGHASIPVCSGFPSILRQYDEGSQDNNGPQWISLMLSEAKDVVPESAQVLRGAPNHTRHQFGRLCPCGPLRPQGIASAARRVLRPQRIPRWRGNPHREGSWLFLQRADNGLRVPAPTTTQHAAANHWPSRTAVRWPNVRDARSFSSVASSRRGSAKAGSKSRVRELFR